MVAKKSGSGKLGKASMAAIKWIAHNSDVLKQKAEPKIDKYLILAAANAGVVYGAAELIDRSNYSDPTNALIMMGTGAILTAGNYYALGPKAKTFRSRVEKFNRYLDGNRPLSWVKTGALATSLLFFYFELNPYLQQVKQDFFPGTRDPPLIAENLPKIPEIKKIGKGYYDSYGYTPKVEYDFFDTKLAKKGSMAGRIQRTLRWLPLYRAVEDAHGMPKNTLAGMIMQESYGDPVQPNAKDDGGLGLIHIQGTTAQLFGDRIYGNSTTDSDFNHGRQIRQVLDQCNYDPVCVQKYDDRAHVLKVLDTAARIVREGKEKYGNWDKGVEYFRAPHKVGKNLTWVYLHDVKEWKAGIENPQNLKVAAEDFENRNSYSFSEYTSKWHEMNENWGLAEYRKRAKLK